MKQVLHGRNYPKFVAICKVKRENSVYLRVILIPPKGTFGDVNCGRKKHEHDEVKQQSRRSTLKSRQ